MAVTTEMIKALRETTGAGVLDCKRALEFSDGSIERAVAYLNEKGLAAAAKKASREANDGLVSLHVDGDGRLGVVLEVNCETDFVARTEDFRILAEALLNQIGEETDVADVATLLTRPYGLDRKITVAERLTQLVAKLGEKMAVRRFARVRRDGDGWVEGYVHPGNRIGVLLHLSAGSPLVPEAGAMRGEYCQNVAGSAAFRDLVHNLALQVAAASPQYVAPSDIPVAQLEAERARYKAQVADEKKPDHLKERIIAGKLEKWYEAVCLLRQPFVKDDSVRVGDLIGRKSQQWGVPLLVEGFIRYELGADE